MAAENHIHHPKGIQLTVDERVLKSYQGQVPRHLAIIMDGNGRWATSRGMVRIRGHQEGANAVRRVVESCRYMGVEVLTLYAFSSQNWGRPEDEVTGLMTLFDLYIKKERKLLLDHQIRLKVIGDRNKLSAKLQRAISDLEERSSQDYVMTLQVAVSYGGREEITRAAQILAQAAIDQKITPAQITPELFERCLYTAGMPDPDLVIRTSGELRISNFLLWQLAYSEIHVTETLWPDFNEQALVEAFSAYDQRERRFGKTSAQLQAEQQPQ